MTDHDRRIGLLLGFGLRPRLRPADDEQYRDVVSAYRSEMAFRHAVDAVADGLGLIVLDADPVTGVTLGTLSGSPFTIRLGDYRKRLAGTMDGDERFLHGLLHLAVAAWCFPTAADLEQTHPVPLNPDEIVDWLSAVCARLADGAPDAVADDEGLNAAWRLFAQLSPTGNSTDGRKVASAVDGKLAQVTQLLTEQGLLSDDGERLWTTHRYRVLVADLAATAVWRAFREQIQEPATTAGASS